jgi:hypothetical protein
MRTSDAEGQHVAVPGHGDRLVFNGDGGIANGRVEGRIDAVFDKENVEDGGVDEDAAGIGG